VGRKRAKRKTEFFVGLSVNNLRNVPFFCCRGKHTHTETTRSRWERERACEEESKSCHYLGHFSDLRGLVPWLSKNPRKEGSISHFNYGAAIYSILTVTHCRGRVCARCKETRREGRLERVKRKSLQTKKKGVRVLLQQNEDDETEKQRERELSVSK